VPHRPEQGSLVALFQIEGIGTIPVKRCCERARPQIGYRGGEV